MASEYQKDYQKAVELAEAGSYEQAWSFMQNYLKYEPNDAQALNDAGAILHCLGHFDQAINLLIRANELNSNCAQIIWNLIEVSLAAGKPEQAQVFFHQAQQLNILNPEVLNRTAKAFVDKGNKTSAIEVMQFSLSIWPNQEILEHMITVLKSKQLKIAFFCGGDGRNFLNPIIEFLSKQFEVRIFEGTQEEQMYELMKWSDVSWFEWCTNLAVLGSRHEKVCKMIIRLHRYEAYGDWPKLINWQNIDYLVTVGNSFVKQVLYQKVPKIEETTSVVTIANGVELDKIRFIERPRGKNLAFVGYIHLRKNPMFLLQCMQKLHYIDPGYKLFFAGVFQDTALEQYLKHVVNHLGLQDAVFFDGWQSDISRWLEDKHYLVSTTISESQGMGILEGMAAGLKPVIHNFPGASEIFPSEYLFNISEQFCEQILSDSYEPTQYRRFVEETYLHEVQMAKINELFRRIEGEINFKQPAGEINLETAVY